MSDCYETSYYLCPSENVNSSGEITNYAGCGYLYSTTSCFNTSSSSNGDGGGGYSAILGFFNIETPIEKARKLAASVPKRYQEIGFCTQYSNFLKKQLLMSNILGKVLQVRSNTPNQNILSDLHPQEAISTNGFHQAIQVGDTVFDNMNPGGIDYNALGSPSGIKVTSESF